MWHKEGLWTPEIGNRRSLSLRYFAFMHELNAAYMHAGSAPMPFWAFMGLKWEKHTLIVFVPATSAVVCVPGGILW